MSRTWVGFIYGEVQGVQGGEDVGFSANAFGLARMKRGDAVYLFTREKQWAVLVGSLTSQEDVLEIVKKTRCANIVISGPFTPVPHARRLKAEIVDEKLREFDYESFMEAVGSRKSVSEIVRGNFEVQRASTGGQVIRLDGAAARRGRGTASERPERG